LTGYETSEVATVDAFTRNLPELLGAMASNGQTFVCLAEFHDGRYVQFWVEPEWIIIGEVVSNLNIGDAVALQPNEEDELRRMGFREPAPGPNPNWRYESTEAANFALLLNMMILAISSVLHELPSNSVNIRTWQMNRSRNETRDDARETCRIYRECENCQDTNHSHIQTGAIVIEDP
jgi:hypothetical protein